MTLKDDVPNLQPDVDCQGCAGIQHARSLVTKRLHALEEVERHLMAAKGLTEAFRLQFQDHRQLLERVRLDLANAIYQHEAEGHETLLEEV